MNNNGEVLLIAALNRLGYMGKDNKLMYKLPKDMQHFKDSTTNGVVIMGRKTFESFGSKPLPNRQNIVLTNDKPLIGLIKSASYSNLHYAGPNGIEGAIELGRDLSKGMKDFSGIWIIGGASIYEQALPFVTKMLLTHVEDDAVGDVKFKRFWLNEFEEDQILTETRDNGYDIEITSFKRSSATNESSGLLWERLGDRQCLLAKRNGVSFRASSVDAIEAREALRSLHVNLSSGKRMEFRFESSSVRDLAAEQLESIVADTLS